MMETTRRGEVTSPLRSIEGIALARRTWAQRIPWLWHDYVVAQTRVPPWALSLLLFVFLYGASFTLAAIDGVLPQFLRDYRWLVPTALPAVSSFTVGYTLRALDRFWRGARPWLADSEEELAAFWAATRDQLMRFFWPPAVIMFIFMTQFGIFLDAPGNWARDYAHFAALRGGPLLSAPFMAYFVGGIFSVTGIGLGVFVRRIQTHLDLKRGFILQGGKQVLRPFNDLLWVIWGISLVVATLVVFLSLTSTGGPFELMSLLGFAILTAIMLPMIVVPQLFMNRWLAQEKAQELRALRGELEEAVLIPETASPVEAMRHLVSHQHLLHQIQRVEAFTPTLVDARFVLQISTSFSAILLANVALRTILARVLP